MTLNAREAAAFLRVSTDTVYAEVRAGRLPHARLGRALRFSEDALRAYLGGYDGPDARCPS